LPATADGELGSSSIMTALHDLSAATLSDIFCAAAGRIGGWSLRQAGGGLLAEAPLDRLFSTSV